jgi:hypothetical protein
VSIQTDEILSLLRSIKNAGTGNADQLLEDLKSRISLAAGSNNIGKVNIEKNLITGAQVDVDRSAIWANSALVNTAVNIDFAKPAAPIGEYMLTVYNPSAVTPITVGVYSKALNLGGQDRYSFITSLSFPANSTQSRYIHGVFNGTDVRFVLTNDTALEASDGFTATLRLREVM